MIGERKNEHSRLELEEAINLPIGMREFVRMVRDVETDAEHLRQGWATKLLTEVCKEADEAKLSLMLEPNGYGEMGDRDLMRWYYKHFRFITVQTKTKDMPCLMIRTPR